MKYEQIDRRAAASLASPRIFKKENRLPDSDSIA